MGGCGFARVETVQRTEGGTSFRVPEGTRASGRGPGSRGPGFYNPAMALTRDLTVLLAAHVQPPPERAHLLDGLTATGVRGLRVAHEVPGWSVELNDHDPRAVALARSNADALGLELEVHRRDLRALLHEGTWRFIEIDPYGSPVPFLAAGVQGVRHRGHLALTATDAAALHGSRANVTRRRYLAEPPPRGAPGWKDAAARLFVAHAVRTAAQFDRGLRPVLVHEHTHAFRATFEVREGAGAADAARASLGHRVLCAGCHTWGGTACACGKGRLSGPYWLGPLQDAEVLVGLFERAGEATLAEPAAVGRLLARLEAEAALAPFYIEVDQAARVTGVNPPRTRDLIAWLDEAGIRATVTHHGGKSVASDAPAEDVLDVLRSRGREADARTG